MRTDDELVTSSTAAQISGYTESTIRLWTQRGHLPSVRLPSGINLYKRRDVERVARERSRRRNPREAA